MYIYVSEKNNAKRTFSIACGFLGGFLKNI